MHLSVQELSAHAEALSVAEKTELAELLLAQISPPDPEIEKLWAEEVERRIAAAREGRIPAVPYEEVMAKFLRP